VSFLLAEQNTMVALRYADFGYILENGRVVMEGDAKELAANEDVKEFYLGLSSAGRKSFRDVKHYRRASAGWPEPKTRALMKFFDALETRDPGSASGTCLAALPKQLAHAKQPSMHRRFAERLTATWISTIDSARGAGDAAGDSQAASCSNCKGGCRPSAG
jgi:hypothetical protein